MSPAHQYRNLENTVAERIARSGRAIGGGVLSFFKRFVQVGRQKFTVMLIPHTEKKVFNFQVSVFALVFVCILMAVLLTGFFALSTHFTGTNDRYTETSRSLQNREEALEAIVQEIGRLRRAARGFTEALDGVLGTIDPTEVQSILPTGTGGDLSDVITVEEYEERSLREISELRRLSALLEGHVPSLQEIQNLLESQVDLLVNIPTLWPLKGVRGRISQPFGPAIHVFTGEPYMHKGVDIAWGYNVPVVATADGKVVLVDRDDLGLGNYLEIEHKYSFSTRYGHFNKIVVKKGQIVKGGEVIGYMGSTGLSNGPHLHYEVKIGGEVVDPLQFLNIGRPLTRSVARRN